MCRKIEETGHFQNIFLYDSIKYTLQFLITNLNLLLLKISIAYVIKGLSRFNCI